MASKTRMSRKKPILRDEKEKMPSSHLSAHMMLSSQLMSTGRFNEGLPAFITRGLDSEQIWQQLELRNDHKLSLQACTREIVCIQASGSQAKKKQKRVKKSKQAVPEEVEDDVHTSGSDSDENVLESIKKRLAEQPPGSKKSNDFGDSDDSEEDDLDFDFEMDKEISKGLSDEDELDDDISKSPKDRKLTKLAPKRTSVVDDKFFKLADMEQFLDSEDLKEERRRKREEKKENIDEESEDGDDDEEEEIDMFNDDDKDEEDNAAGAKYSDFFDPPDDETVPSKAKKKVSKEASDDDSEGMGGEDESTLSEIGQEEDGDEVKSDMEEDEGSGADEDQEDEDDDEEDEDMDDLQENNQVKDKTSNKSVSIDSNLLKSDDDDEEEVATVTGAKSTFEKKQEQLQAQAREMEEQSLKEAPWELMGEATATKRPDNSLLETVLDFQHTTRAAPVITDETTKTLEDFIKQRIKDKAFDDVERKEKPKEDPFEFKKRIVLDQEKSKMSLGELYEQEFLKQQQQDKDEVKADPECEKIETDLKKLFQQLDALCNFRYTPMKAGTEVKILVNTPAISMEEVAPTATTDAQLLAPEEVKEKIKGDLKADDERDPTDKKRDRRQKKKEKRERKKAKESREKAVEKMKPGLGNKYSKAKAIKQLEQLSKTNKNVTLIKGDHQKLSSSTSFFNQLQEEVQTNVRAKKAVKEKNKKNKVVDASKLML